MIAGNVESILRGMARMRLALDTRVPSLDSKTLLAVDVDIYAMYVSPQRGAGYTSLNFLGRASEESGAESDSEGKSKRAKATARHYAPSDAALAAALARWILVEQPRLCANRHTQNSAGFVPVVLLPGHSDELNTIFASVHEQASRATTDAFEGIEEIQRILNELREAVSSQARGAAENGHESLEVLINEKLRTLVNLLFGDDSALSQHARFLDLVEQDVCRHMDRFEFPGLPSRFVDSAQLIQSQAGQNAFKSVANALSVRLDKDGKAPKSPSFDERRALNDANALAAMYGFCEEVRSTEITAMVLVTGAQSLLKWQHVHPTSLSNESPKTALIDPLGFLLQLFESSGVPDLDIETLRRTFDAVLVLLHDRYVADTENVGKDREYVVWMHTLVHSWVSGHKHVLASAVSALDGSGENPTLIRLKESVAHWDEFVRLWFASDTDRIKVNLEPLQEMFAQQDFDALTTRLKEMYSSCVHCLYISLGPAAVLLGGQKKVRNIPALRLGEMDFLQTFVRGFVHETEEPRQLQNKLPELLDTLTTLDKTGYALHMVIGIAFATFNHWGNALFAFGRAKEIAEQTKKKLAPSVDELRVTGCEAAYAAEFACRVHARKVADLEKAHEHLLNAVEYARDRSNKIEPDIRFEAEEYALFVVQRWFEAIPHAGTLGVGSISQPQPFPFRIAEPEQKEWPTAAEEQTDSAIRQLWRFVVVGIDAKFKESGDTDKFVRESIQLQSWSALLQLRWLWLYRYDPIRPGVSEHPTIRRTEKSDPLANELKDAIADFCRICKAVEPPKSRTSNEDISPFLNPITDLVHWVARLEVATGVQEMNEAAIEARNLVEEILLTRTPLILDRIRVEFFTLLIDRLANRY